MIILSEGTEEKMRELNERQYYQLLKRQRHRLTIQQYRTIKGQIRAKDYEGAKRGLQRLSEQQKRKEFKSA